MHEDWLQHWRTLAAAWDPYGASRFAGASALGGAPPAGASEPYAALATGFAAAVRSAIEGVSEESAETRASAIDRFVEFLRAQFSDLSAFSALGPQRAQQQRWQRMTAASLQAQQAQAHLARLWSDTLRAAADAFAQHCIDAAQTETAPKLLYAAWVDSAEEAYARMAHSAAFCSAQTSLLNAQNRLRRELQSLFEPWAKDLDLPTRSELNSVHRAIRAMRAEIVRKPSKPPAAKARKGGGTARRAPKRRPP